MPYYTTGIGIDNHVFIGATALSAADVLIPTDDEITAYCQSNDIFSVHVWYNGTDADADPSSATHVYAIDKAGLAVLNYGDTDSESELVPYKNVEPIVRNINGQPAIGPLASSHTMLVGGDYVFEYSGTVDSGTGGITITRDGTQLFVSSPATGDTDGARLSTTRQSNFTPPITLAAGDVIEIAQWAGGGGLVTDHTVCGKFSQLVTSFGDAKVTVINPVAETARQHITVTNTSGNQYGISDYLFHLSDDPTVVGTLSGTEITLEQGVPKSFYLVGPSTEGAPADGDLLHNGTVTGVHFTATFDGADISYDVVEAVRHHPGPGDWDTRTYDSVVAQQTVALTLASTNFDLLFDGFAISTPGGPDTFFKEKRCYEELGAAQTLNGGGPGARGSVTVASLGAGPHQSYTATQDIILSNFSGTLVGDVTVQWTTPSASDSTSFTNLNNGGNIIPLNNTLLKAGETLEFTFIDDGGANVFHNVGNDFFTPGLSGASGWEGTLSFAEANIKHEVNVYDNAGVEELRELNAGVLAPLASIPAGWNQVDCPDTDTFGTVETATTSFKSTNGIKVPVGGKHQKNPNGTTLAIPSVAEYNEFINNYKPQYLALSYEGAGGSTAVVTVNGVAATFKDLNNATDAGNGQINFSSGANSNFNRLARVDGAVLKDVGDYVEISGINVASYSGMYIGIFDNETDFAHSTTNVYRLIAAAGANQNVESYSFRDSENNILASGSETNAVYRITRTLGGISFARAGVELYCTEVTEFTKYPTQASVTDPTGIYRVGEKHSELTSIANTNDTIVVTGHDLTQATGMELRITFQDDAANHKWATQLHDVDELIARAAANATADGSSTLYDTGYVQIHVEDAATGALRFVDTNREISYVSSELRVAATSRDISVVTATLNSGTISNSYTLTFPATVEEDPDNWKQANNQDFAVPAERAGRYLFNLSVSTSGANASADLTARLILEPADGGAAFALARDTDPNETAGARGVSMSAVALLSEGDIIRCTGFSTGSQTLTDARLTITELDSKTLTTGTSAAAVEVDTLADFSSDLKIGNGTLSDGRHFTTVEDNATTSETIGRAFDSTVTPFVEIEVVRDSAATHGPIIRANEPGSGRQAQLRFNLTDGASSVANSGANTSLPIIHQMIVEEETIKYLIEFTDPVAHTELEIGPAGHDVALTPSTAQTGLTSFVDVRLYETNPLGTELTQRGIGTVGTPVVFPIAYGTPPHIKLTPIGSPDRIVHPDNVTAVGFDAISWNTGINSASNGETFYWEATGARS